MWERILYNQSAKRISNVLLCRQETVVIQAPYRREDPALYEAALGGERTGDAGTHHTPD